MKTIKLGDHSITNGDCIEAFQFVSEGTADLIISDPPYFKVIGEKWDYQWRTEKDYLEWSRKWIALASRSLRIGGTMYVFGFFRTLAMMLPILKDLGFSLRQQIVIDKGIKAVAGRATKNYRMFPCVTESILFLVKDNIPFSRDFLKSRQAELNLTSKQINAAIGVKSNGGGMWSIYTGKNVCEQFPTKETWGKLEQILNFRMPYEKIAQTFNPHLGFTDVWRDIDFYSEHRYHPTQKPLKLIERLVSTSSNPQDLVIDPFAGSGSTLFACDELKRKCVAFEKDNSLVDGIVERYFERNHP